MAKLYTVELSSIINGIRVIDDNCTLAYSKIIVESLMLQKDNKPVVQPGKMALVHFSKISEADYSLFEDKVILSMDTQTQKCALVLTSATKLERVLGKYKILITDDDYKVVLVNNKTVIRFYFGDKIVTKEIIV